MKRAAWFAGGLVGLLTTGCLAALMLASRDTSAALGRARAVAVIALDAPVVPPKADVPLEPQYFAGPDRPADAALVPLSRLPAVEAATRRVLPASERRNVADRVELEVDPVTRRLDVVASGQRPLSARRLADAYSRAYVALDRRTFDASVRAALASTVARLEALDRRDPERAAVKHRLDYLRVLLSAGPRPLRITQRARNVPPASDPLGRGLLLSLGAGIAVGAGAGRLRRNRWA